MTGRAVSDTFKAAAYAPETDEVFILLLTLDHADLADPIRVTPDNRDLLPVAGVRGVVSRSNEYIETPFSFVFPKQDDSLVGAAKIRIDNVDRTVIQSLRAISTPADVTVEVVLSSDPDTVEISLANFKLRTASYDFLVVEGDLVAKTFAAEPWPKSRMVPSRNPGLF